MTSELIDYLGTRRSTPAAQLGEPGPDDAALASILRIAARVPDHGKLAPWRFVIYPQGSRQALVDGLLRIAAAHPDEKERRMRADKIGFLLNTPVLVGVFFSPQPDHPKIPLWEQQLSAGAACLNLLHAAEAHGFSGQWLTGWSAYDPDAVRWMGGRDGESVAGYMHLGTPTAPPFERDRPDMAAITQTWQPPAVGSGP